MPDLSTEPHKGIECKVYGASLLAYKFHTHGGLPLDQRISLEEEVAKLRAAVEELVYWVRPMTGRLVTGKAAVEEYRELIKCAK